MSPKDVERIISDSGFTLHLDTERFVQRTVLQNIRFAALKEKEYFLELLSNFKVEKSQLWPFLLEKYFKIPKIVGFSCQKSLKFEENQKINIYS